MQFIIGLDAKLYYGTAGSPAATELTEAQDVTLNLEMGEAKANCRATKFALSEPTLLSISLDWDYLWDETDAGFIALWNAFVNRTPIAIKCLSKAGGKGLDCDVKVFKFNRSEALEEGVKASVSVKPCPSTRMPAMV